jgi:hypothetical protein
VSTPNGAAKVILSFAAIADGAFGLCWLPLHDSVKPAIARDVASSPVNRERNEVIAGRRMSLALRDPG